MRPFVKYLKRLAVVGTMSLGLSCALGCSPQPVEKAVQSKPSSVAAHFDGADFGPAQRWIAMVTVPESQRIKPSYIFENFCPEPPDCIYSTDGSSDDECPEPGMIINQHKNDINVKPLFDLTELANKYATELANQNTGSMSSPASYLAAVKQQMREIGSPDYFGRQPCTLPSCKHEWIHKQFCLYEYIGSDVDGARDFMPNAVAVEVFPDDAIQGPLAQDCSTLSEQDISFAHNQYLMEEALEGVGAFVSEWGNFPAPTPENEVHVVVIDTTPEWTDGDPIPANTNSWHGQGVASWIKRIVCPDGQYCPITSLSTKPGLNLTFDAGSGRIEQDDVHGGWFGYNTEVAVKMVDAIYEWEILKDGHLIINTSLGGEFLDDFADVPHNGVYRAFKAAFQMGAYRKVLTSVSAGNSSGSQDGNPSSGPMIPGMWAEQPSPRPVETPNSSLCESTGGEPLIVASYGLNLLGEPLYNTRPGGKPPLAAWGYEVPVDINAISDGAYGEPTYVNRLTGTSMSAAAVTAAAALAWAKDPSLDVPGIQDVLRVSGDVQGQADYGYDYGTGAIPDIIRLDICDTVEALDGTFECSSVALHRTHEQSQVGEMASCAPEVFSPAMFEVDAMSTGCPWTQIDLPTGTCPGASNEYYTNQVSSITGACAVQGSDLTVEEQQSMCALNYDFNYLVGSFAFPNPIMPDSGTNRIFNKNEGILYFMTNDLFQSLVPGSPLMKMDMTLILKSSNSTAYVPIQGTFPENEGTAIFNLPTGNWEVGLLTGSFYDAANPPPGGEMWLHDGEVTVVGQ